MKAHPLPPDVQEWFMNGYRNWIHGVEIYNKHPLTGSPNENFFRIDEWDDVLIRAFKRTGREMIVCEKATYFRV